MEKKNNILIGCGLSVEENDRYRLILKSESVDEDFIMTTKEYHLIRKVLIAVQENRNRSTINCDCGKYTTGACSTSIGFPALSHHDMGFIQYE